MSDKYSFDELLRATTELTVTLPKKKVTYYLRGLTNPEKDRRHKMSVLAGRKMRRELQDTKSDAYLVDMAQLDEEDNRQVFVDSLLGVRQSELANEAASNIVRASYPEPSENADIGELIDLEDEEDQIEEDVRKERIKFVEDGIKVYEESLADKDIDELRAMYAKARMERLCNEAYLVEHTAQTLYFAVFSDEKRTKRIFKNVEEVTQHGLYERLRNTYYELDRWSGEQLKN